MSTLAIPSPRLEYGFWSRENIDYLAGGDLPLATVHEVTVSLDHQGNPSVWVTGRMLKKDGTPGPRRCSQANLDQPQPDWMRQLLADALPRLDITDVLRLKREGV